MINYELFQLIEKSGEHGITAKELAAHTGRELSTVRSWCSRWTAKRYLKRLPAEEPEWKRPVGQPECRYVCGEKEWARMVNVENLSG